MSVDDRHLVALLRPFVRAAGPVLTVLSEPDLFGLRGRSLGAVANIDGVAPQYLGRLRDLPEVLDERLSRLIVLLAAVPSVDREALRAAAHGVLLCAIAGEQGNDNTEFKVRLLAAVLFDRDVDPAPTGQYEDRRTAELTSELTESARRHGRYTVKSVADTMWRLGRSLGTTRGRSWGALGERLVLSRLRKRAQRWILTNRQIRWDPRRSS